MIYLTAQWPFTKVSLKITHLKLKSLRGQWVDTIADDALAFYVARSPIVMTLTISNGDVLVIIDLNNPQNVKKMIENAQCHTYLYFLKINPARERINTMYVRNNICVNSKQIPFQSFHGFDPHFMTRNITFCILDKSSNIWHLSGQTQFQRSVALNYA